MSRPLKIDPARWGRINVRISRKAIRRLNYACELREQGDKPIRVTQGDIVNEVLLDVLPPHPSEAVEQEQAHFKRKARAETAA
jgi:hypothetical protein